MGDLRINGTDVGVVQIRPLKPGVTIEEAQRKLAKDGLDEVFFTQDGKHFVAFGENLNLSTARGVIPTSKQQLSLTDKDGKFVVTYDEGGIAKTATLPVTEVKGEKVRIEGVQDKAQSAKEGAQKRVVAALAAATGGAVVGGGMGLMAAAVDVAKDVITRKGTEGGYWIPAAILAGAGAVLGGAFVAHGAYKGAHNQVDMAPLNAITQ